VPVRTLERRISAGEIRTKYVRMPHRRSMLTLCPEDLQRLVESEGGSTVMLPPPQQIAPLPASIAPMVPANDAPPSRQELVLRRASRSRYVTLPEASKYIGLPEAYLRRLIRDGRLPAIRSGALYVRTADLDRL
jgi:excisionase family DNA binding protein